MTSTFIRCKCCADIDIDTFIETQANIRIDKQAKIDEFVANNSAGYAQGTDEWKNARRYTVGGSEIGSVEGVNKHCTRASLVARKSGVEPFKGSLMTRFGNLFEDLIQQYVEWDNDTIITGTEISFPGPIPNQSFSPDGLGVVDKEVTIRIPVVGDTDNHKEGTPPEIKEVSVFEAHAVLFEFKCPYMRLPGGIVPEYYRSQVKAGLDSIRDANGNHILDYGIYAEGVFRRCPLKYMNYSPYYNRQGHMQDRRRDECFPLSYGFIGLTVSDELIEIHKLMKTGGETSQRQKEKMELFNSVVSALSKSNYKISKITADSKISSLNDIGDASNEVFDALAEAYVEGVVSAHYSAQTFCGEPNMRCKTTDEIHEGYQIETPTTLLKYIPDDTTGRCSVEKSEIAPSGWDHESPFKADRSNCVQADEYSKFRDLCIDGDKLVCGVLPWKLFQIDYHEIQRQEGYLDSLSSDINYIVGKIKEVDAADDYAEKLLIIDGV